MKLFREDAIEVLIVHGVGTFEKCHAKHAEDSIYSFYRACEFKPYSFHDIKRYVTDMDGLVCYAIVLCAAGPLYVNGESITAFSHTVFPIGPDSEDAHMNGMTNPEARSIFRKFMDDDA